jgi:hypothetical protein
VSCSSIVSPRVRALGLRVKSHRPARLMFTRLQPQVVGGTVNWGARGRRMIGQAGPSPSPK